jgi:hypothetical protein
MPFEIFRNPFEKSKNSSHKFESLRDSLNSQANRKGLQYPIDLGVKDQQNFLLFTVYDANPQSFKSSESSNQRQSTGSFDSNALKQTASNAAGALSSLMNFKLPSMAQMQGVSNFYKAQLSDPMQQARLKQDTTQTQSVTSKTRFSNSLDKTMYSIALYMPGGISSTLETTYNMEDFGMLKGLGAGGKELINKIQGLFDTQEKVNSTEGESVEGAMLANLKNAGIKVGLESVDAIANLGGINLNAANAVKAMRRAVTNPHMEFLFQAVTQRSYSFNFKFTPRNIDEAKMVHDIIRIFRAASLPSKSQGGVMLDFPAEFDIQYFRGGTENTWIPKISRCALTSIAVNYTPNELPQSHAEESFSDITGFDVSGPIPASMSLAMTFAEMSTLVREDVVEGGF